MSVLEEERVRSGDGTGHERNATGHNLRKRQL